MLNHTSRTTRRDFLLGASTMTLLAAHDEFVPALARAPSPSLEPDRMNPRIRSLRLLTAAPLDEMKAYYRDRLDFAVLAERDDELTVRGGLTIITFVTAPPEYGRPFYHFAFNIPEQKILAARAWQLERTPLFDTPDNLRDPDYPNDVRHFRSWNAHSVFFFDPAENVLEYIARHDLPATREQGTTGDGFDVADILYASEIAFVSDDVIATAGELAANHEVKPYRPGNEQFHAMGDEEGLLLVFARGRALGAGSGTSKEADVFPTGAVVRGGKPGVRALKGYPYKVTSAAD